MRRVKKFATLLKKIAVLLEQIPLLPAPSFPNSETV
jgi:hypothetical protein